ncbi:MAG: hypothetical protein EOO89_15190, partial [Pedobacter sp.]
MSGKVLWIALLVGLAISSARAQDLRTTINENKALDSLRKKEEKGLDSVVFTSKYVKFTTLKLSRDSIQLFPLDTSLNDLQHYSMLFQTRRPTTGLGNLGLAARPMLFEAQRTVGFDPGFHSLDLYTFNHEDVVFYEARSPFSTVHPASRVTS